MARLRQEISDSPRGLFSEWVSSNDDGESFMSDGYSFVKKLLVLALLMAAGIIQAAAGQEAAAAPQSAAAGSTGGRVLHAVLEGSRVSVFDTSTESCELIDIPDAPARAFRDYLGTVHLVSSHYVLRASLGPTLDSVRHSCEVAYRSKHDPNPAHFDDATWLDSFYSVDGRTVVALGHMEYHGWEHPGMCSTRNYTAACWYNADTLHHPRTGAITSFRWSRRPILRWASPSSMRSMRAPRGIA
jgi:hypothetical protein